MVSDTDNSHGPIPLTHPLDGTPFTVASLKREQARYDEPAPDRVYRGGVRKVALIGSASSIDAAPWWDPSWEIWSHGSCHTICRREPDRFFDQHPWTWIEAKDSPGYVSWLKRNRIPIYMTDKFSQVPASRRYPLERIRSEYPLPFGSHASYMVALALSEGVTHIGFFGIHYEHEIERAEQRHNAELWAGVAFGRGVQLVIPPSSPFCRRPSLLYGYESHAGAEMQKRLDMRHRNRVDAHLATGEKLTPITVEESAAHSRPGIPKDVENMRRAAAGLPALLPNGQPAW